MNTRKQQVTRLHVVAQRCECAEISPIIMKYLYVILLYYTFKTCEKNIVYLLWI